MNIAVAPRLTRAAEGLERRRFTLAEVEAMVEAGIIDPDERFELIGGELVPMASKGIQHESVKVALLDHWVRARPETCRVAPETTFRLSDDTFLEPDFVIYPTATKLKGLSQSNVLLVVEVAGASRYYDKGRKAEIYASFGVRELWVIDAVHRTTSVFLAPREAGYAETHEFAAAEIVSPRFAPPEFTLRLDDLELA
jgi:Uma2 family endonuclease